MILCKRKFIAAGTVFWLVLMPMHRTDRLQHKSQAAAANAVAPSVANVTAVAVADELETQIDASIRRALAWLATQQRPSGAWRADDYGDSRAATSLAIMAFLAGGHVPDEGPFGK